ncbi:hypothetical protein [Actinoplanes sp. DH11]|uniref:hypothetical protein n=1 Tax=Actinoplanes sp. DH11 TaxID=2857011 RepID=UPI001E465DD1|nr:hypothetical protein [Actinoplanes sp. DH11]
MAVLVVCGSWIFKFLPGAFLLYLLGVGTTEPPWTAMFLSGLALMLACIASLIASVALADRVRAPYRRTTGPPEQTDWAGLAESGGADSGGSGGD